METRERLRCVLFFLENFEGAPLSAHESGRFDGCEFGGLDGKFLADEKDVLLPGRTVVSRAQGQPRVPRGKGRHAGRPGKPARRSGGRHRRQDADDAEENDLSCPCEQVRSVADAPRLSIRARGTVA